MEEKNKEESKMEGTSNISVPVQEQAQRFNDGKLRVDLIEPGFIMAIAQVLTYGANKYSANNWKTGTGLTDEQIDGSLERHFWATKSGEIYDKESGLPHLYHVGCNLMFKIWKFQKTHGDLNPSFLPTQEKKNKLKRWKLGKYHPHY